MGTPVRVHPLFWVVGLLLGLRGDPDLAAMLIWLVALFVSILVHEMGHAFMVRYYGGQPWVTLYGFGGLCSYQPLRRGPWSSIFVSLAGPGAGFLLLALVLAGAHGAGYTVQFIKLFGFLPFPALEYSEIQSNELRLLIFYLVRINYFWGLLNLMPLYPLDGGQISRELFMMGNPQGGIRQSLWLSVFTGAGIAFLAFTRTGQPIMGLMFGYLAFMSWRTLQAYSGRGGFGGGFGGRGW